MKLLNVVQDAEFFYVVGDYNEEVTQPVEANAAVSEGTAERSTPTRVRRQNNAVHTGG